MSVISGPSGCGLPLGENGASMIRPGASFAFARRVMRTTGACRSGRERKRSTAAGGSVRQRQRAVVRLAGRRAPRDREAKSPLAARTVATCHGHPLAGAERAGGDEARAAAVRVRAQLAGVRAATRAGHRDRAERGRRRAAERDLRLRAARPRSRARERVTARRPWPRRRAATAASAGDATTTQPRTPPPRHRPIRTPRRPELRSREPRDAHVDAVAAERYAFGLEERALARALRQRAVRADDPVPRHVGVVAGGQHRCPRSAARRARRRRRRARSPGGMARMRARTRSVREVTPGILARHAPRHLLDRRARPGDRRARRRGAVALVLRRLAVHLGAARASAPSPRSRWSSPRTARTRSTAWPPARRRPAALARAARRRPAAAVRQVGVVDARGGVAVSTGADCIPCAGDAAGAHWTCQANMMERDTVPPRCRPPSRRPRATSPPACSPRCRAPRPRAATSAGASRPRCSSCPPEGEPWQARIDLRVEDHADPLAELARLLALQRAYELAGAADELLAAGRDERGRRAVPARRRARARLRRAAVLGRARRRPRRRPRGRRDAVRRAAERHPGWLLLLDRLSPDFAPAAGAVRQRAGPVAGSVIPAHERRTSSRRASAAASARRRAREVAQLIRIAPQVVQLAVAGVAFDVSCVRVRSPAKRSPPPRRRRAGPSIRMSRPVSRNGSRRKPNSDTPSGTHGAVAPAASSTVGAMSTLAASWSRTSPARHARPAHQQRHADRRLVGQHLAARAPGARRAGSRCRR